MIPNTTHSDPNRHNDQNEARTFDSLRPGNILPTAVIYFQSQTEYIKIHITPPTLRTYTYTNITRAAHTWQLHSRGDLLNMIYEVCLMRSKLRAISISIANDFE